MSRCQRVDKFLFRTEQEFVPRGSWSQCMRKNERRLSMNPRPLVLKQSRDSRWGIIADDLTGACDVGAAFAQRGFTTAVLLNPDLDFAAAAQVTVLSTHSRNDATSVACRKVRRSVRFFSDRKVAVLYKK